MAKTCHCIAAAEDVYMKAVQQKETALSQAVWDCIQRIAGDIGLATVSLASPAHLEALERLQVGTWSGTGVAFLGPARDRRGSKGR